jgi:branched-chain amino acid transport system permease protein
VATFAFQIIVFSVMNNCVALTGGPMGLPGIPKPVILGWKVDTHWEFLAVVWGYAVMVVWASHRLTASPFGRLLKSIREDETLTEGAGKNVAWCKVRIFAISAAMAAVAGVIYAHYISFIDPTSFTVMESIFILSIVIIGGAGSLWGPVVGAIVLVTLPELLRFVGLPTAVAANIRQILYGGLLVAFMMWRPQGILGEYAFEKGGGD